VSVSALTAITSALAVGPGQAAAATSLVVENVVNAELLPETEEGPPPGWSWRGWDTTGGTGVARIEIDDSEPVQHDGSLHVATPAGNDAVQVRQVVPLNRTDGPSLQGTTSIGFDVRVVARAEDVLEQDPERVGQPRDVEAGLERVEAVDLDLAVADGERRASGERVGGHLLESIEPAAA
jgi:hypothetical protein